MTEFASSIFRSPYHVISLLGHHRADRLRTGFGRRIGCSASAPVRGLIERLGYPLSFKVILGDLETARRGRVSHSAIPPTEGVGLRRCALRLDGRRRFANDLRVD